MKLSLHLLLLCSALGSLSLWGAVGVKFKASRSGASHAGQRPQPAAAGNEDLPLELDLLLGIGLDPT